MTTISVRKAAQVAAVTLFAAASFAMAQESNPTPSASTSNSASAPATTTGGWRRVGDSQSSASSVNPPSGPSSTSPQISQSSPNGETAAPSLYPEANDQQPQSQANYPQAQPPMAAQQPMGAPGPGNYPQPPPQQQRNYAQIPSQVTIPAGTYLTVRVNQHLSSDHNQVGDPFSATLSKPVISNGLVVAEPGQTLGGRVAQVQKSGHVSGLARLGVELTDLTLVDGQQVPVKTMFVSRTANSTVGRDAGAIVGTTGVGAAIGAAADWGRGAAIGAGAGLVASTIGVLVTRGQPSVIYPEQSLTFKLEEPITISTERSPQAFHYVQPNEYSNQLAYNPGPGYGGPGPSYGPGFGAGYAPAPVPYAYGYPYYGGYPYYPYSGFSFYVGPRFYGPGFYGRGYYGGFRGGFRR